VIIPLADGISRQEMVTTNQLMKPLPITRETHPSFLLLFRKTEILVDSLSLDGFCWVIIISQCQSLRLLKRLCQRSRLTHFGDFGQHHTITKRKTYYDKYL